jgi:hypothetical protein
VCRIDQHPDNKKQRDGKRIDVSVLSSIKDSHVYKNYLDSLGVKIVVLDNSILCYKVLFASTLTRFYRFWYLDPSGSSFAVLSWCKIAYAYNIEESMELIPYPKITVILMDDEPDLDEILDIFRIFNFMDTEAWLFPLEIQYGKINFASQADLNRVIMEKKAKEIKEEEKDIISELSISQEKSKSLNKNNKKKKKVSKEKEEYSSSSSDLDFEINNEKKREDNLENNIGYDIVKKRKLRSRKKEVHEEVDVNGQSIIHLSSDSESEEVVIPAEFRNNKKEKVSKEKHLDPRIVKERNEKERKEFFDMLNNPNNNTNNNNNNLKQEDPAFGFELLNIIPGNENDNRPKKRSFSEEKSKSSIKKEKLKPIILQDVKTDKKNNSFMVRPFNQEEECEKEIEQEGSYNFKPKNKIFIEEIGRASCRERVYIAV